MPANIIQENAQRYCKESCIIQRRLENMKAEVIRDSFDKYDNCERDDGMQKLFEEVCAKTTTMMME
jgi:hypothetical protein